MPLTRSTILSRALVIIALGASIAQALFSSISFGFAGPPASVIERLMLIVSGLLCMPALASWKFPRAGFVVFVLLFGTAIILCTPPVSPSPGWVNCWYLLLPGAISGVFLLLNLMLVVAEDNGSALRHRSD